MRILRKLYRVIALFLWGTWHGIYCLPIRYLYREEHSIRRMALQTKYWCRTLSNNTSHKR